MKSPSCFYNHRILLNLTVTVAAFVHDVPLLQLCHNSVLFVRVNLTTSVGHAVHFTRCGK